MGKSKILTFFSTVIILCLLPVLSACGDPAQHMVPVVRDWTPPGTAMSGDSIVLTPGGPSYAGNTAGANPANFPSVKITQIILENGAIQAYLSYREAIESPRGETRYIVVTSFLTGQDINDDKPGNPVAGVSIYTRSAPEGLVITDVMQWTGGLSNSNVLQLELTGDLSKGEHTFEIGVIVNGIDFGTLPCTLTVTG